MYGCEVWKLTKTEAEKLDAFRYKCMKRTRRIRWPQTISHQRIQEVTGVNRASDENRRRSKMNNEEEEQGRTLLYGIGVEGREEEETRSTKNNMEENG